jgi:glutathione S-transferase
LLFPELTFHIDNTVSAPPKQAKPKVQDAALDALEAKLGKSTFLSGNAPSKADAETFAQVQGKSLVGYPRVAGWYSTVSMFESGVRGSW